MRSYPMISSARASRESGTINPSDEGGALVDNQFEAARLNDGKFRRGGNLILKYLYPEPWSILLKRIYRVNYVWIALV